MNSSSFPVASLGFLYMVSCHLQTMTVFFFSSLDSFLFCFSLLALARTSKTGLNESGESGYPYLVPGLKSEYFQLFTVVYDVSCGFVVYLCFSKSSTQVCSGKEN